MMKAKKQTASLSGVKCDVTNCVYNDVDLMCHANQIQVANQSSNCKDEKDTCCHTFEAK